MFMATVTLVPTENADAGMLESGVVADIVWAAAKPDDGLEHVHAKVASGRIELTFFHCSSSLTAAISAAGEICRRTLDSSPALARWRISATSESPHALPGSGAVLP